MKAWRVWIFLAAPPAWSAVTPRVAHWLPLWAVLGAALAFGISWQWVPSFSSVDAVQVAAAQTTKQWMQEIKNLRRYLEIPVDTRLDPAESGLIGDEMTDLTSTIGSLAAKQTSLNPDFAALVVMLLRNAGVRPGDSVALSLTGSFPALNLAVLAACLHLELKPTILSSLGASSYGAVIPGLTWADMERHLNETGAMPFRSRGMSLGGIVDTEGGIDGTGIDVGLAAIAKAKIPYLPEGERGKLEADILRRLALYTEKGKPAAFINVGGAVTALGWVAEAALLNNGLLQQVPATASSQRGLLFRMHEIGVPVIHLLNIERLAARYGLPISPVPLPQPGTSLGAGQVKQFWELLLLLMFWAGIAWAGCRLYSHSAGDKPTRCGVEQTEQNTEV